MGHPTTTNCPPVTPVSTIATSRHSVKPPSAISSGFVFQSRKQPVTPPPRLNTSATSHSRLPAPSQSRLAAPSQSRLAAPSQSRLTTPSQYCLAAPPQSRPNVPTKSAPSQTVTHPTAPAPSQLRLAVPWASQLPPTTPAPSQLLLDSLLEDIEDESLFGDF